MTETTTFIGDTDRWKQESVLNLANHFHKFDSNVNQQLRVTDFRMTEADLVTFKGIVSVGKVKRVEMHLALTGEAQNNDFTVCMYLLVEHGETTTTTEHFKLYPKEKDQVSPTDPDSDIVPLIFKQMIANNWDEIDFHLIDDLFIAMKNSQLVRVRHFKIGDLMIQYINNQLKPCVDTLLGVKIYAGVDLNKFSNKETISFTPVIGFHFPEAIISNFQQVGIKDCIAGELFMEYSLPCPPTCPNSN